MPPQIHQYISLKDQNTFHIEVKARYWAEFASHEDLVLYYRDKAWRTVPKLILSGGSNVLFVKDFSGLVLHPSIRGIDVVEEDADSILVNVGAGENWDDFVAHAVSMGWHGIENLSWIPGCVGTGPVQNIGAYGAEIKDVVEQVEYWSTTDFGRHLLANQDCRFAYRDSIFKQGLKKEAVITRVRFRLSKVPRFTLAYADLKQELAGKGPPTLTTVRDAVIAVRKRKLPDPAEVGNAGSFFKNPEVTEERLEILHRRNPSMPVYPAAGGAFKVPAGWLVERCGWKGFREGDAGVHPRHALVLVNYGSATGEEIQDLAARIETSVFDRFGIELSPEVTIL
ncbi:MAG: UDP-N-acetylmuramate dehydrogenase [Desulfobacterales bacterium]|nr:UDP-N-acetylmuramate dehydrogenase [Desulfobacterales bacterium]